eukprot:TRINITY_DN10521_c0_g3_i1.p1 TRINITY_DN10521_c0_g3~~TRINITY_DN10521_c0_g3_i1.p1  ORF type:complete len:518 (+),score=24.47 TRINITY_DN10521_c0_g3_i1:609-2162(+)
MCDHTEGAKKEKTRVCCMQLSHTMEPTRCPLPSGRSCSWYLSLPILLLLLVAFDAEARAQFKPIEEGGDEHTHSSASLGGTLSLGESQEHRNDDFASRLRLAAEDGSTSPTSPLPSLLFSHEIMDAYTAQGELAWVPARDKFLYMFCSYGGMRNRLMCYRNSALIAGLLNRTLLVNTNSTEVNGNYDRSVSLDLMALGHCIGHDTIMTFDQFRTNYNEEPYVDQVLCLPKFHSCPDALDEEKGGNKWFWTKAETDYAADLANVHGHAESISRVPFKTYLTVTELLQVAPEATGRVLWVGDGNFTPLLGDDTYPRLHLGPIWAVTGGDLPFMRSDECERGFLIKPHPGIFQVADKFVEEMMGGRAFMAAHLRRGNFVKRRDTLPLDRVLECFRQHAKDANMTTFYLATDADMSEMNHITKTFQTFNLEGPPLELVHMHLPRHGTEIGEDPDEQMGWRALYRALGWEAGDDIREAFLDKAICAKASAFLGSLRSGFTTDIMRMRYGLGTANEGDRMVCQ